tara:strand:- start:4594 stop:5802 length:1209 start_codon:yes stop_codon:yes gene_type:complete
MPRATDILIVLTYAMIAVVAALAFDRFGLMSTSFAWLMGAFVFLIAGQAHSAAARSIERKTFEQEIHELQAANLSILDEMEAAQTRIESMAESIRAEAVEREAALTNEVKVLEDLVRRMGAVPPSGRGQRVATDPDAEVDIEIVREALSQNRVDLYLQPVVSLPQRKTYFYEGYTRLRDAQGGIIAPSVFIRAAEEAGLVGEVDNLLLFRCIQIVRRLTKSDRRIGIFCNLSLRSLTDETFFPAFLDFMRRNSDLAGSLIFEIAQSAFDERSPAAARNMARLADYGFRFSIDQVRNLNIDLAEMQRAGVRFAKVEGTRLIDAVRDGIQIAQIEAGSIEPQDIAGLFARYGVDLIAEKIESEATIVEILDIDVAYAQGHLFGEPRPVKEEILESAAEPVRLAS